MSRRTLRLEAALLLRIVRTGLRLGGFHAVWDAVRRAGPGTSGSTAEVLAAIAWSDPRGPRDDRCLVRALAAAAMLHRRGVPATVVIGVRHAPFGAHAWLVVGGQVVLGDEDRAGHVPLWSGRVGS